MYKYEVTVIRAVATTSTESSILWGSPLQKSHEGVIISILQVNEKRFREVAWLAQGYIKW